MEKHTYHISGYSEVGALLSMKKKFNDPNAPCQLGNTRVLTELMDEEDFAGVKEMGFMHAKKIFYWTWNISMNVEY